MRVDEPRDHGVAREVDDACAYWDRKMLANGGDKAAADENVTGRKQHTALAVEQATGMGDDD